MSQLVGLALGISPAEMGMPKRHLTDTAAVYKICRLIPFDLDMIRVGLY